MAIKLSDYSNDPVKANGQVRKNEGSESFQVGGYAQQVQSFTVTATGASTASLVVTDEVGNVYSFSHTGTGGDSAVDIRDALLLEIQGNVSFSAIASAASAATADIAITALNKGKSLVISSLVGAGSLSEDTAPESGSAIVAGRAVVRNASDNQHMELPGASSVSADLLGIVIRKHAYRVTDNNADLSVPVGSHGEVLYRGEVLVEVDDTVAPDDPVYIRKASGTLGIARNDDASGDAILLAGAKFIEAGVSGDYVAIRVNQP